MHHIHGNLLCVCAERHQLSSISSCISGCLHVSTCTLHLRSLKQSCKTFSKQARLSTIQIILPLEACCTFSHPHAICPSSLAAPGMFRSSRGHGHHAATGIICKSGSASQFAYHVACCRYVTVCSCKLALSLASSFWGLLHAVSNAC